MKKGRERETLGLGDCIAYESLGIEPLELSPRGDEIVFARVSAQTPPHPKGAFLSF